jgi:uncharacterized phage protein gp47/JayE
MAFQVKDFVSITASMINWMRATTRRVSDYNIGSVVRTMLEAVAAEIDELYQQFFIGVKEAIPVSVYNSFSFEKLAAISANGLIRVTLTPSDTAGLISAGTTFSATGLPTTYTSLTDVVVGIGMSFVDVSVKADAAGSIGNISALQEFTLNPAPDNFVSATNLSGFASGVDAETDDERKIRFAAYIASISRSTNAALRYGMSTATLVDSDGNITERVATAITVEPYLDDSNQPIAKVDCYIHNGVGGTSTALLARTTEIVDGYYDANGVAVAGYKAAGIKTTVFIAAEELVSVTGELVPEAGFDEPTLITNATTTVYAYLQNLPIGGTAVLAEIIYLIKDIDGVYDFQPSLPAANVTVDKTKKLMPGSINIT